MTGYPILSRSVARLLPVVALLGLGAPLVGDQPELAVLGAYIAAPFLVGSTMYYSHAKLHEPGASPVVFKALLSGYFLLQTLAIFLLVVSPVRPLFYYVVIGTIAALIAVQILMLELTPSTVELLLGQIAALLLNIVWGVTFKYHYFFGRTDTFPHVWWTEQLIETGYVTSAFGEYEPFPLWHILTSTEYFALGMSVDVKTIQFFTSGLAFAFGVVGVYLATKVLFGSKRISLMAALMMSINPWVIFYGMYSIPRSIVSILCVFTLYAMLQRGYRYYTLVIILTIGMALYHTVSLPFFVLILGTFYTAQLIVTRENAPLRIQPIITIIGIQLGYWLLFAPEFAERIFALVTGPSISGSAEGGQSALVPDPIAELINYLPFSFLVFLLVVALVRGLVSERIPKTGKAAILAGTALAVVSFPGPILLAERLAANLNMIRFGQYTYPFLSMACAVGVVTLYETRLEFRNFPARKVALVVVVLLFVSMGFFGVSNDFAASDNPVVEREFYTFYLSESEQQSLDSVGGFSEEYIISDQIGCRYIDNTAYPGNCNVIEVNTDQGQVLTNERYDLIVVREAELQQRGLKTYPTDEFVEEPPYIGSEIYLGADEPVWGDLETKNKVYTNGDVGAYKATNVNDDPSGEA